jgi:hypothetical protein
MDSVSFVDGMNLSRLSLLDGSVCNGLNFMKTNLNCAKTKVNVVG